MACSCSKNKNGSPATFVVTSPDGSSKVYSTEIEAVAASKRVGGTWRLQ